MAFMGIYVTLHPVPPMGFVGGDWMVAAGSMKNTQQGSGLVQHRALEARYPQHWKNHQWFDGVWHRRLDGTRHRQLD